MADKPDYDLMPAGREMDAMVAEKVMGWFAGTQSLYWLNEDGKEHWVTDDPRYADRNHWHPSEDISAAWEVVEKVVSLGKYRVLINPEDGECQVDLYDENYMGDLELSCGSDSFTAPTAPLAICRAALKAVSND